MKKTVPNYLHVFEGRIDSLRRRIKSQYSLPKKDRSKAELKAAVREARSLRDAVREAKDEHAANCPHCGKKI
jgi:hypothetical protein